MEWLPGAATRTPFYPNAVALGDLDGVGDLDGDGRADLAFADPRSFSIFTMLGRAPGKFLVQHQPFSPALIALADFDGDGRLDTFTADQFIDEATRGSTYRISVAAGVGDGTFGAPVYTDLDGNWTDRPLVGDLDGDGRGPTLRQHWPVAVGDLDGDGRLDLLTSGAGLQVYFGGG